MSSESKDYNIKDYLDVRLKALEDKIDALYKYNELHFELNEKAIKKAEDAMSIRVENMSDFQEQYNRDRSAYVAREACGLLSGSLSERISKLEMASAFTAGKMWMVMAGFAAIPTVLALIALFK